MTHSIDTILSYYSSESTAIRTNLYRLLTHGKLGGSGKILIQAVDQGFEHGPTRSYVNNLDAMDPNYHFQMACDAGISSYTGPIGWLEQAVDNFVGKVPLILKLNSGNSLFSSQNQPDQANTASVKDAVRLGCIGVGFTLYPGSDENLNLIREASEIIAEARSYGLFTVLWSYARGGELEKKDETALDVISYGAHMACLLGAHIVKVKIPSSHIAMKAHLDVYENIPKDSVIDRVRHVVQCCFNGKRIVIFSGGETKSDTDLLNDIHGIQKGGGFGSIMGRNIFQRPKENAIKMLSDIQSIFLS